MKFLLLSNILSFELYDTNFFMVLSTSNMTITLFILIDSLNAPTHRFLNNTTQKLYKVIKPLYHESHFIPNFLVITL
jgi:hypothetical protein